MTPADEQAIAYAEIGVQLSAIFRRAEEQAQSVLQARRNAYRRTEDWESVAERQRAEIAALDCAVVNLRQDLMDARESNRAYARTLTGVRAALETNEDEDLTEQGAALRRAYSRLERVIERLRSGIALARAYKAATERINGVADAEAALFAWLDAQEQGDEKNMEPASAVE